MVTKEVKVKSYTRKTKSGKSVIVRAHTAKHKCSDKGCGSGEELLKKKNKKYEVLGVDMSQLSDADFKDFASQHYAYDDDDNLVWAPSTRSGFKKFMEKHYAHNSEESSNFKWGFNDYVNSLTANKVQKKTTRKKKDELPKIKYQAKYDNNEPGKPRRNPRAGIPKWMKEVNAITRRKKD